MDQILKWCGLRKPSPTTQAYLDPLISVQIAFRDRLRSQWSRLLQVKNIGSGLGHATVSSISVGMPNPEPTTALNQPGYHIPAEILAGNLVDRPEEERMVGNQQVGLVVKSLLNHIGLRRTKSA